VNTLICCGAAAALLSFATATAHAAATSATGTVLGPIDSYFVTQTSLGTPFQVDAGRVAEVKETTRAVRDYGT
jgi:predicted outer membrane protein